MPLRARVPPSLERGNDRRAQKNARRPVIVFFLPGNHICWNANTRVLGYQSRVRSWVTFQQLGRFESDFLPLVSLRDPGRKQMLGQKWQGEK